MCGLVASVTEFTIPAHCLRSQSAEVSDSSEQFLSVPFPIEHHLLTASPEKRASTLPALQVQKRRTDILTHSPA
jgi:hypothetical protein